MNNLLPITTDSINPSYWGPGLWRLLYSIGSVNHNEEEVKKLIAALGELLPCEECRKHFGEHLKAHPVVTGAGFFGWVNELHNSVNKKTSKAVVSLQSMKAEVEKNRVRKAVPKPVVRAVPKPVVREIPKTPNFKKTTPNFFVTPNVKSVVAPVRRGGCGCGGGK